MNNIVWKSFVLSELFETKVGRDSSIAQKNLNISKEQTTEYNIAIVTETTFNNGIGFYLKETDKVLQNKIVNKGMTYGVQFGNVNWHNYPFFIIGNVNYILFKDIKLQNICSNIVGNYFAKILTKCFKKTGIFNFMYKIDQPKFGREYILLPCIECDREDSIWEENGRYYTLAVEYIESLMERAKERREENTIKKYEAERKKYEAERKKYEAERKKYEADYLIEKNKVVWKKFKLEDVFNFGSFDLLNESLKQLNTSSIKDDTHTIAVVTQSGRNNGVVGYVEPTTNIVSKQVQNAYTFSNNFGICFYHNYKFVIPANNAISLIEPATDNLKDILNNSIYNALFFATIIHKICCKSMYNYMWKPSTDRVKREYILLPCIECNKEESIWEENEKYYTLPINYISYIYLTGRIKYYQKLIDNYTYRY